MFQDNINSINYWKIYKKEKVDKGLKLLREPTSEEQKIKDSRKITSFYQLSQTQQNKIQTILEKYPQITEIYITGSAANGTHMYIYDKVIDKIRIETKGKTPGKLSDLDISTVPALKKVEINFPSGIDYDALALSKTHLIYKEGEFF